MKPVLQINKKRWVDLSEEDSNLFLDDIFTHYRMYGFPFFPTDENFRRNEFKKLVNYDNSKILDDGIVKQTMHGLSLAWSYMPHSWQVVCNNKKTPMQAFLDDETFKGVIRKRMKFGDNISDNGIRKMLKIFTNVQSVSNFRPTAAAAIYKQFCNKGDIVWDMSSGFGGRLLGAHIAGVKYIGTDPSTLTHNGLVNMSKDFDIDCELIKIGSEDYRPESDSLDFCFTSPPYFDTEVYSSEDTQSCVKYPNKELWLDGYLHKTINNCYIGLKQGKYAAINIANVKSYPNLVDDTISVANKAGFKYVQTLKLALSNINSSGFKYEPILIFIK